MSFMRGVDITRAIGRVGLKVEPVLGPEIWTQNRAKTEALGNRPNSRKCVMYVSAG